MPLAARILAPLVLLCCFASADIVGAAVICSGTFLPEIIVVVVLS
jgi:hypothetical protein